jgi:hypothetical protein
MQSDLSMALSFFKRWLGVQTVKREDVSASTARVMQAMLNATRAAWVPVADEGEGGVAASRFGGRAALRRGELHAPLCRACSRAMPLWLQLDLVSLPSDAKAVLPEALRCGLFQLFYCTREDCECADCGAFPVNTVVRFHAIDGGEFLGEADPADHPAKLIRGWRERAEIPVGGEGMAQRGEGVTADDLDEFYNRPNSLDAMLPLDRDKLLGWPDWVQGVWYPDCPDCGKPMAYLLQIASNDHVDFMFGDSGVGHVLFCPEHLKRATFLWQCC